ncbi:MAG: glycerophosphodiester phosphodiesterase family protein [Bacteroidales bacterium]|nr:glycerophosphodiester phosphodiesterase family protein [Bacteroidales bacterium]
METAKILTAAVFCMMMAACAPKVQEETHYYTDITSRADLYEYFQYSPERPIVICGHRGGMVTGYPENCIESFEKTLTMMPAFFEIDPRLTKDDVIVLMHDATIDRTTTGTGYVSDYTYEELQEFNLVDRDGNVTDYKIPSLADCLEWSQGKCVFNIDMKDVPADAMVEFLSGVEHPNVMYIAYNADEARDYIELDPGAMISCSMKTLDDLQGYIDTGVPWQQMTAFLGSRMNPAAQDLYDTLHENGVMTMLFYNPRYIDDMTEDELIEKYDEALHSGCDVLVTDYPYLLQSLSFDRE